MDPIMLMMMVAANDPARWGPILDALGPQFGPNAILPGLQNMHQATVGQTDPDVGNLFGPGNAIPPPPSAPLVPGNPGGIDFSSVAPPNLQSVVPGINISTPPPGMADPGTGLPPPTDLAGLLALFNTQGSLQPPGGVTPPTGPGAISPPVPLTRVPPPNTQPQIKPPTAAQPIMSGGVPGAQKAPEIGVQSSTGGTPAAMLLAAIMNNRNSPNPLRVPTLGSMLAG